MRNYLTVLIAFYHMGGRLQLACEAVKLFNRSYRNDWSKTVGGNNA